MTSTPDWRTSVLAALGQDDSFAYAIRDALSGSAREAVRKRFVIEIVAQLHDALTDYTLSESEAYETFVRTVALLAVFLPEGRKTASAPQDDPVVLRQTSCAAADVHIRLADAGHPTGAAEVRTFRRRLETGG